MALNGIERVVKKLDPAAKRSGMNWICRCPRTDQHRHGDHQPSLFIQAATGEFHCFGCGWKGGIRTLQRRLNMTMIDSRPYKAVKTGQAATMPSETIPSSYAALTTVIGGRIVWTRRSEYLIKRNVTVEAAHWFGLHTGTMFGNVPAIIYPVEFEDRMIWGARLIGQRQKYYYPPNCGKTSDVYRLHSYTDPIVILCEGIFDAIRIWEAGYYQVCPLLGKIISQTQILCLTRSNKIAVIMVDRDAHGKDDVKIRDSLSPFIHTEIARLTSAKDPGEASIKDIQSVLDPILTRITRVHT